METNSVTNSINNEPYCKWLGVRVVKIDSESVRLQLPFKEANSNPGRQLHGGAVASMLGLAARTAALAGTRVAEPYSASTVDMNVGYLSSAIGEAIEAEARVLRRGKELCYVRSEVFTPENKPIATASIVYRAAPGADPALEANPAFAREPAEVTSFARMLASGPFISGLGITPEHMKGGTARVLMPHREPVCDSSGALHEGALGALIDTCGSFAAWSLITPRPGMKPSTVALNLNFFSPARGDVIARSRNVARRREIFFNEVEVETATDHLPVARGTVIYRIVLPE